MENNATRMNSAGWLIFVKTSFVLSIAAMAVGILIMDINLHVKGYLGMGSLMLISSSFTLSKTMRDEFESSKLVNIIKDARTERMLQEYEKAA